MIHTADVQPSRLPSMSVDGKGGVPPTGVPSGKFLRDDATWQTVSGSGTPSDTVASETSFGLSPAAGVATTYSRGDHTRDSN